MKIILYLFLFSTLFSCTKPKQHIIVKGDLTRIELSDIPKELNSSKYGHEIYGPAINIIIPDLPEGKIFIKFGLMETYFEEADSRVFSIFANGELLSPYVDVFAETGKNKPYNPVYDIAHPGGELTIKLEGIKNDAKFHFIEVSWLENEVLALVTAKEAKMIVTNEEGEEFRNLAYDELTFFNVDHSPVGAYSTLMYGDKQSGGIAFQTGRLTANGKIIPEKGVIFAVKTTDGTYTMPFYKPDPKENENLISIDDSSIERNLLACSDSWNVKNLPLRWTHYSAVWQLNDIHSASTDQIRNFLLPSTIIEFDVAGLDQNSKLLFSLQRTEATPVYYTNYHGYKIDESHCILIRKENGRLLTSEDALNNYGVENATTAIEIEFQKSSKKTDLYVCTFHPGIASESTEGKYLYTEYFSGFEEIAEYTEHNNQLIKAQCQEINQQIKSNQKNEFRKFLSAHAMHSYRFNTFVMQTGEGIIWGVPEGQYGYVNTFDLVVDQLFYELKYHPWTIRNVLDLYADKYYYYDTIHNPETGDTVKGGISFCHDMGISTEFMPKGISRYENRGHNIFMTQEELQNWILCASGYVSETKDFAWLEKRKNIISECLESMLLRDHPDPKKRDGITDYITTKGIKDEITTYDALDHALKQTRQNLYITVKSWASYLALFNMLDILNMPEQAATAKDAAIYTANTIISKMNESKGYIPAVFDNKNESAIIPAVEALVYPYKSGIIQDIETEQEFTKLLKTLKAHLTAVLEPGICIDATSGSWKLSSTSDNTWQSKVYLNQYVAEEILKLNNTFTTEIVDQVHASFQVLGAGKFGWSDQLRSTDGKAIGSKHYPRGVTCVLWWDN